MKFALFMILDIIVIVSLVLTTIYTIFTDYMPDKVYVVICMIGFMLGVINTSLERIIKHLEGKR